MKFEIIKDEGKLRRKRQYLKKKYPYTLQSFGRVVSYEMPVPLTKPFPQIASWLSKSCYPRKFWGIEYFIATNHGYLERIVPAAEYYKLAFRTIAEDLYSLERSRQRLQAITNGITEAYHATRKLRPETGQPSFKASNYVYELKSELGSFFFLSRSVLDTAATLMHFLYGPTSRHYGSFTNFIKQVLKASVEQDVEMRRYFESNLEWYYRLKDIRDYITHYKSVDISFYEQSDARIHIYLEDRFKLDELVSEAHSGIKAFLQFMDEHFTKYLQERFAGILN